MANEVKVSAYIKDERTGKFVRNLDYKKVEVVVEPTVTTEEVITESEVATEEVVANAEESANENVTVEVPVKAKKTKKK